MMTEVLNSDFANPKPDDGFEEAVVDARESGGAVNVTPEEITDILRSHEQPGVDAGRVRAVLAKLASEGEVAWDPPAPYRQQ